MHPLPPTACAFPAPTIATPQVAISVLTDNSGAKRGMGKQQFLDRLSESLTAREQVRTQHHSLHTMQTQRGAPVLLPGLHARLRHTAAGAACPTAAYRCWGCMPDCGIPLQPPHPSPLSRPPHHPTPRLLCTRQLGRGTPSCPLSCTMWRWRTSPTRQPAGARRSWIVR
jgi:hypothetical protein